VKPEDLDICVENNNLTIRGERKFENKVNEKNYLRVEWVCGAFRRSFSLANTVNSEAIQADYKNGVLTLTVRKQSRNRSRSMWKRRQLPLLRAGNRKRRCPASCCAIA
jgi:HSP20 family protein